MKIKQWLAVCLLGILAVSAQPARAQVRVGIGIGVPVYRPWWGPCYRPWRPWWYGGPVVYVAPAPAVVVEPAAVVVGSGQTQTLAEPPVTLQPAPAAPQAVAGTTPVTVRAVAGSDRRTQVDSYLHSLSNSDERIRSDAVLQLGRLKAPVAVDPLAATLAGDRSPTVRETAARALGLIGSPKALTVLQHAAQADPDRDVRRSAQFAVEVIQTNQRQ
jgi:hypothetical protein